MTATVITTTPITDGNATVQLPAWHELGSISTGNTGAMSLQATITVDRNPGGTVLFAYSVGSGPTIEFASVACAANVPTTGTISVDVFSPGTLNVFLSTNDNKNVAWTNGTLTLSKDPSHAGFPQFTPIVPPPPIGDPISVPVFPPVSPATAPVAVPQGPLVGPAVGGNLVGPPPPPYPPTFKTGSATSPTAASWFPQFTTTFPSPTVVFANLFNLWPTAVPMTTTTQNVR